MLTAMLQAAYDTYKRTLDAIVAKYDKQQAILAAGGTLADYFDSNGEPLEQQLQLSNGSAVTAAAATATSTDGSKRVVLTDSAGNQYRDWGAEGTDVETLIEELRLEQEVRNCGSVLRLSFAAQFCSSVWIILFFKLSRLARCARFARSTYSRLAALAGL
jgi:hypothetical protein